MVNSILLTYSLAQCLFVVPAPGLSTCHFSTSRPAGCHWQFATQAFTVYLLFPCYPWWWQSAFFSPGGKPPSGLFLLHSGLASCLDQGSTQCISRWQFACPGKDRMSLTTSPLVLCISLPVNRLHRILVWQNTNMSQVSWFVKLSPQIL